MAAAETVKTTIDQFTSASSVAFKDNVEKTLAALNEANGQSKRNLEAVVASVTAATKGAEALGAQAMAFSKKSFEDQVAAAKSLASAKSVQEVVELQTGLARSFLESYLAEVGKLTEAVSSSVKDSLKPLNERVTDLVVEGLLGEGHRLRADRLGALGGGGHRGHDGLQVLLRLGVGFVQRGQGLLDAFLEGDVGGGGELLDGGLGGFGGGGHGTAPELGRDRFREGAMPWDHEPGSLMLQCSSQRLFVHCNITVMPL